MRGLRAAAVQLGYQVRERHRMAEFLQAARGRRRHEGEVREKRLEAIPWTRYCSAHEAEAATGPGPRRVTL